MYHVLFGKNDVRQMTLDQVDDCFRLGVITEETMLWTDGMKGWETLKEAAGLGGEASPSSKAPPPPRRGQASDQRGPTSAHGSRAATPNRSQAPNQSQAPSRRSSRAEPPPRRRASNRGASSPEVITSARPMQMSQPSRTVAAPVASSNPFLQTAPSVAVHPSVGSQPAAFGQNVSPMYQPQQPYYGQAAVQMAPVVQPAPAARAYVPQTTSTPIASTAWPTTQAAWSAAATQVSPSAPPASGVRHHGYGGPVAHPSFAQPATYQGALPSSQVSQSGYQVPNSLAPFAMAASTSAWDQSSLDDVPFARSSRGAGARFQGWLLTLCFVAGGAVVAYRNDYLFQIAKSVRQESNYLAIERQYLGGAPNGTPRDVKKLVDGMAPAIQTVVFGRDNVRLDSEPLGDGSLPRNSASEGASVGSSRETLPASSSVAAVSPSDKPLVPTASDAEAVGRSGSATAAKASGAAANAGASVGLSSEPKTSSYRSSAAAAPEPKREPVRRNLSERNDDADEKPARASRERAQKSEPESRPEPMPAAGTDDFLHMSMRQAIKKKSGSGAAPSAPSEAPKKKKSSRADYDPLNGDI